MNRSNGKANVSFAKSGIHSKNSKNLKIAPKNEYLESHLNCEKSEKKIVKNEISFLLPHENLIPFCEEES